LRNRIRRLERGAGRPPRPARPLGLAALDQALPWGGLPPGCLHHIADAAPLLGAGGACASGAATAFAALLADRLARTRPARPADTADPRPVVWCLRAGGPDDSLYGPGLAALGLTPNRLLVARAPDAAGVAWAMEEAARCPDVGAVIGQIPGRLDAAAGRRLTLAAETGGAAVILLRPARRVGGPSPIQAAPLQAETPSESIAGAVTRWRVAPLPSTPTPWGEPGRPRWRLSLELCRQGHPQTWTVEWCHDTGTLDLAANLHDGSPEPSDAPPRRRSA